MKGTRNASGWSLGKWLFRMVLWVPPLTPIGIWLSLRHHRWKGERRMLAKLEREKRQA